jgi:histidine triad (HIT) family protein
MRGEAPSFPVFEDDVSFAFLDWRPLALGHVLLVPRTHYGVLADVPDDVFAGLSARAKRISAAVITAIQAEGSFLALNNIVSQSVPHVHFHIVPRRWKDGVFAGGMIWKRVAYESEQQQQDIAGRIRAALA